MSVNKKSRFNIPPYYDDFDEEKKFLQVLFKPGQALQARELTQLQSILNNQIGRFGDHIFEDGDVVQGGGITERRLTALRLNPYLSTSFDYTQLINYEIEYTHTIEETIDEDDSEGTTDPLSGLKTTVSARVVHAIKPTSTDPYPVLFVEIIKGTQDDSISFPDGTGSIVSTNPLLNVSLTVAHYDGSSHAQIVNNNNSTEESTVGNTECILISIDQGIFYINGNFVLNDAQSLAIFEEIEGIRIFYPELRTCSVGFSINREIATAESDPTLKDPSQGNYNYNAPGADRYIVDLKISQIVYIFDEQGYRTDFSTENYFEFARIIKGQTFKKLKYPEYAKLEETLARRTYDESGHYTVVPFGINSQDYTEVWNPKDTGRMDPYDHLAIGMEQGKAYVRGFEFELQNTEHVLGKKARTTQSWNDRLVDVNLGNYILVEHNMDGVSPLFRGEAGFMFNENTSKQIVGKTYKKVYLSFDPGSGFLEPVGCARISQIARDSIGQGDGGVGVLYRFYLNDIRFGTRAGFSSEYDLKTIKDIEYLTDPATSKQVAKIYKGIDGEGLDFYEKGETELLFKVPEGEQVKEITGLDYYIQDDYELELTKIGDAWTATATIPSSEGSLFQGNLDSVINDVTNLDEYLVSVDGYLFDMSTNSVGDYGGNTLTTQDGNRTIKVEIGSGASDSWTGTKTGLLVANLRNNHDDEVKSNKYYRKKVLKRHTATITNNINADNSTTMWNKYLYDGRGINLGYSDIFMIESVTELGTNTDFTGMFTLDNGQRPSMYDFGSVALDPGQPGGTGGPNGAWAESGAGFKVTFLYFDHQRMQTGFDTSDHSTVIFPSIVSSYTHSDHEVKSFDNGGKTATFVQESTDWWAEPTELTTYNYIPSYTNPDTGETIKLSDVIDFRPMKVGGWDVANSDAGQLRGVYTPQDGKLFFADYSHYLPRIDKLVLTKDREFKILEGIPGRTPLPPEHNPEEAMVLYVLYWNAYTTTPDDVSAEYIDNQRFTMEQIGEINERVTKLEEVTQLSIGEIDAKIQSEAYGNKVFLNAMVVDSFQNTESADIDNPDHNIAIDPDNSILKPSQSVTNVNLVKSPLAVSSGVTGSTNNIFTLEPISRDVSTVNNLDANVAVSANPFEKSNWVGTMTLSPSSDDWIDTTRNPTVLSNVDGSKDPFLIRQKKKNKGIRNGWGGIHNWWFRNWIGNTRHNVPRKITRQFMGNRFKVPTNQLGVVRERPVDKRWWKYRSGEERLSELSHNNINQNSRKEQLKGRIVDKGVVPFVREREITATITGMRPKSKYYVFVDGTKVNTNSNISSSIGVAYVKSKTNHGRTDENGNATVVLQIPKNSKYRAGKILIRVCDSKINSPSKTTTVAEAFYIVNGNVKSVDEKITSTREILAKRDSAKKERITQDAQTTSKKQVLSNVADYFDPMAQKFTIDSEKFPRGVFLTNVELFFQAKDDKDVPFQLHLRPIQNNVPHPTTSIPLSEVSVKPSDITVRANGPSGITGAASKFNFSSPVFVEPGEYAIVCKTNSKKYKLWSSVFGSKGLSADGTATLNDVAKQPYVGNMFEPQNNGARTENKMKNLMFRVNRAKYPIGDSNAGVLYLVGNTADTTNADGAVISTPDAHEVSLMAEYIKDPASKVKYQIQDSNNMVEMMPNTSLRLSKRNTYDIGDYNNPLVTASLSTDDENITPVVDMDRLSVVAGKYEMSINTTDEEKSAAPTDNTKGMARYVGKQVRMDTRGNRLKVKLEASKPYGTNVKVYAKLLRENERIINNKEWIELTPEEHTNPASVGEKSFYEYRWSYQDDDLTIDHGFISFITKIVLTGDETKSDIPQVRKMKTYSLWDTNLAPAVLLANLSVTGEETDDGQPEG